MTSDEMLPWLGSHAQRIVDLVRSPAERIFWLYLLSAFVLALGVYLGRRDEKFSCGGLFRFVFPAQIYGHASAKTDYLFALVNRLLYPLLVLPFAVGGLAAYHAGQEIMPWSWGVGPGLGLDLAFGLMSALALDLGMYVMHFLFHRVPFLWEFHKVHHSAEVLTPITVYRVHPLDDALNISLSAATTGFAQGLWMAALPATGSVGSVSQLNLTLIVFYIVGYNLRHSHIWIDFGWADRLFVSPAMHQIHHSLDPRHQDKNIGFMFSIWDRLAGTAVLPVQAERLRFGIDGHQESEYQGSAFGLYWIPIRKIFANPREVIRMDRPVRLLLGLVFAFALVLAIYQVQAQRAGVRPPVWLEELTWTEVRAHLDSGWTRVIVPTGGTEQNGPHMVLGKHNQIVAHTAERVAKRVGRTLVAPVMAYVPEGKIEPPTGHMMMAGTLSLDDETFERVLESTARSLIAHGFREIYFMGDSGGNQAAQAIVADRLSGIFTDPNVIIASLDDYYANNSQVEWLESQGETRSTIGTHAGIRDTSEILYLNRSSVRSDRLAPDGGSFFAKSGVSGDPTRASFERGRSMLRLKVKAAVRQIRRLEASVKSAP